MANLLQSLTGIFAAKADARSKDEAKQRLKLLLIHDQIDLSPAQLDKMKDEILEVIGRYCETDADDVTFDLRKQAEGVVLQSTIPVRRITARA